MTAPPSATGMLFRRRTRFQDITLRRDRRGLFLTLNGSPQVHSSEEQPYHDCMATIPLLLARHIRDVVILGGGDGLAARNILNFSPTPRCTLVELDDGMIDVCAHHPQWRALTHGSLTDRRLTVVVSDAIAWLQRSRKTFDVIIHDLEMNFTDQPQELTAERCFDFFTTTFAKLRPGGIWVLTVPSDADEGLPDGAFTLLRAELSALVQQRYRRARGPIAKVRLLLHALFPAVRSLTIAPSVLGKHTTFYISNAPIRGFRRPSPVPLVISHAERRLGE